MDEREAYIGFAAFSGIGPLRLKLLVDYFGSAEAAWSAPQATLLQIGLGEKLTCKFVDFRKNFSPQSYEAELRAKEIEILTRIDPDYPKKLLEIPDPPIVLFIKGKLPAAEKPHVAVVGTRKPTAYGKQVTQTLTRDLVANGCTIVSGLARGIDGIAHRTAVENHGLTIAVLGCGVDIIYPPEHRTLYGEIIAGNGAIVSEVPPGHTVLRGLFPARNRIISGLSLGIIVTEGAEDSGSLITARLAAEQGREVFAVPGPITSYLSAGPTKLIKQGAKLVTDVQDILEELDIKSVKYQVSGIKKTNGQLILDEKQKTIVDLLVRGEMHYDEIIRESGFSVSQVGNLLTQLELSGIIRSSGNGKYGLKEV